MKRAFSIIYYLLIVYMSRVNVYIYIELGYKLRVQVEKEFEIGGTRDDRSTVVDGQG